MKSLVRLSVAAALLSSLIFSIAASAATYSHVSFKTERYTEVSGSIEFTVGSDGGKVKIDGTEYSLDSGDRLKITANVPINYAKVKVDDEEVEASIRGGSISVYVNGHQLRSGASQVTVDDSSYVAGSVSSTLVIHTPGGGSNSGRVDYLVIDGKRVIYKDPHNTDDIRLENALPKKLEVKASGGMGRVKFEGYAVPSVNGSVVSALTFDGALTALLVAILLEATGLLPRFK